MQAWARRIMGEARPLAELLDAVVGTTAHTESFAEQMARLDDPDRTPSARILAAMRRSRIPFFRFAMNQSILHKGYFVANPLTNDQVRRFTDLAERSLAEQRAIEATDRESFDEHLARYLKPPSIEGA
jgi:glutamate--cysteine ligase